MSELPLYILTDAGFSADEADAIVRHLVAGVDVHDPDSETDQLPLDSFSPEQKDAVDRFTMAVAADA